MTEKAKKVYDFNQKMHRKYVISFHFLIHSIFDGKLPFKSLLKFDPGFGPAERQTTGDCVSHATRNAIDITRSVEIDIKGDREQFVSVEMLQDAERFLFTLGRDALWSVLSNKEDYTLGFYTSA